MPRPLSSRWLKFMIMLLAGCACAGTAAAQNGSLRVVIFPPEAAAAGAQWRWGTDPAWHNPGETVIGIPAGSSIAITFKNHPDWHTPAPAQTLIRSGQLSEVTGVYRRPKADLSWTTALGGAWIDQANAIAVGSSGDLFIAGFTESAEWVTGGAGSFNGGDRDAFVARLSPEGRPVWSACLGGANEDWAWGVALDATDNICVTGSTYSSGWTSSTLDGTLGGTMDAFVVKLGPDGRELWSRYLGSDDDEFGSAIAVTSSTGTIYVVGETRSAGWLTGGYNTAYGGLIDGFVAALSSDGQIQWGSYLGNQGLAHTSPWGVAVDHAGNISVAGFTNAPSGFVSGGYDTEPDGGYDGFVVQLDPAGAHRWSTCLGGAADDYARGVAIDRANNVCVAGTSRSGGWASKGFDTANHGGEDAFAVKLTPSGQHAWSALLGGADDDSGLGIAVDEADSLVLTGETRSAGWVRDGDDETHHGDDDAFVARIAPNGLHLWSGYLGDAGDDSGFGAATAVSGVIYAAGKIGNDAAVWRLVDLGLETRRGALRVTIQPPEAMAAGAQWRRGGPTAWRDGGTSSTGIPAGPCLVEFKPLSNWTAPSAQTVMIRDGQTTTVTGNYIRHTGSLQVTITPPEAGTAGARWRRVGTGGPWLASGAEETGIPVGSWTVEFSDAPGWITPAARNVTIEKDLKTAVNQPYVLETGSLRVDLNPTGAVLAGARWRRVGSSSWLATGQTETGIMVGDWMIEFKDAPDWITPARRNVTISRNNTTIVSQTYAPGIGSLQVFLTPGGELSPSARWRRVGTVTWFSSGQTELSVPIGQQTIEFNEVSGWLAPPRQTVMITGGQLKQATGAYQAQYSRLSVRIHPPEAAAAGAQWRRVGTTTWRSSGTTETGIFDSTGEVEFNSIAGWNRPANQPVTFVRAQATQTSATYMQAPGGMIWGTYLGGSGEDVCTGIGLDGAGNIYVCGYTGSSGWVSGGYDTSHAGQFDGFAVKITSSGQHLWSSLMGGSDVDQVRAIAVDAAGNCYLAGHTNSSGWVSGGYDTSLDVTSDGFLVKLTPAGAHAWSTYLGKEGKDYARGVATDGNSVFVTGTTGSSGWLTGGFDTTFNGGSNFEYFENIYCGDIFVIKFTSAGQHVWGTYLGGSGGDSANAIALDPQGNLYLTGLTKSAGWLAGGYDLFKSDLWDGFAAKLRPDGTPLWGTYLGGSGEDCGFAITPDPNENVLVTGSTGSDGWISGEYENNLPQGKYSGFVIKLSGAGAHLWSSYVGGFRYDDWGANGVAADASGNVLVTGFGGGDWVTGGADITMGATYSYIAKFSQTGRYLWSSYIGEGAFSYAIILDGVEDILIAGKTNAGTWMRGGYDITHNGYWDGFVVRLKDGPVPPTGTLSVILTPSSAVDGGAMWRIVGTSTWHPSGNTLPFLLPGRYKLEFKTISNVWNTPANVQCQIEAGQTTRLTVNYVTRLDLSVQSPPLVLARAGDAVSLVVTASGASPITFQWKREGVAIPGATGTTLNLIAEPGDSLTYTCEVRNFGAVVESPPFQVVVHPGAAVMRYLLGLTSDDTGLDLDGDDKVTIADALRAAQGAAADSSK